MKLAEAVLREVVDFKVEDDRFQVCCMFQHEQFAKECHTRMDPLHLCVQELQVAFRYVDNHVIVIKAI